MLKETSAPRLDRPKSGRYPLSYGGLYNLRCKFSDVKGNFHYKIFRSFS